MSDQLELAYADRRAGQDANLAAGTAGHRDHRAVVEQAVAICARSNAAFTADTVHKIVAHELGAPYDHNLVSSVMGTWAAAHRIIRQPNLVNSAVPARKGSKNGLWRGNRDMATATPLPRAATA